MIKHLPEGLVPYEDCGFARYPNWPLENEPVSIACRTEDDTPPSLWLRINGIVVQASAPRRIKPCYWRFQLGAFSLGDKVSYQFRTGKEQTRIFTFETEREIVETSPRYGLYSRSGDYWLAYEHFHIRIEQGYPLSLTCMQGPPPSGEPIQEFETALPGKDQFILTGNKKGLSLKRLSHNNESSVIFNLTSFSLRITADGTIRQITERGQLNAKHVWGTGERYHSVDLRNSYSSGRVTEKFTQQSDQTYLPVPFFMTENGIGWYRETTIAAPMDFRDGLSISQRTHGNCLSRDILFVGAPAEILQQFIRHTGEPVLPPDWAFGIWISANGWNCDEEVDTQLAALKKYDYPADVMVLEAWSDEQTFYLWNDTKHWKDPAAMVQRVRDAGLHLLLWQIPVIKCEMDQAPSDQLKEDEEEAIQRGYCVLNADGTPYRITENWFHNSLLPDFTNPEAVSWWFGKRKHLLDIGVEGFKTDGGEFLYDHTARLYNGMTGLEAQNAYPSQYIQAYHDFLRDNNVNGVTFSRADFTGAQTRPLHWAGDQLSRWSELKAQLHAGISAGLSGLIFWGFDIGGFAGELPSVELYLRATAFGCFCPIMQWHAEPRSGQFYATHEDGFNNDRSPWNLADKLNDSRVLEIGIKFAKLRRKLQPYLVQEAVWCAKTGRPMMAHLCLDYPEDPNACKCDDQYMLGRDLMICPIVEEDRNRRSVWMPKGKWRHWFTGKILDGEKWMEFDCPLDEMIALERM